MHPSHLSFSAVLPPSLHQRHVQELQKGLQSAARALPALRVQQAQSFEMEGGGVRVGVCSWLHHLWGGMCAMQVNCWLLGFPLGCNWILLCQDSVCVGIHLNGSATVHTDLPVSCLVLSRFWCSLTRKFATSSRVRRFCMHASTSPN